MDNESKKAEEPKEDRSFDYSNILTSIWFHYLPYFRPGYWRSNYMECRRRSFCGISRVITGRFRIPSSLT